MNVRSSGQNFFSLKLSLLSLCLWSVFSALFFAFLCLLLFFFRPSLFVVVTSHFSHHEQRERKIYTHPKREMMMMHSCSARTPPTVVVENTKVRYCFFVVSNSLFALSLSSFTSSSSLASTRSLFCLGEILFG